MERENSKPESLDLQSDSEDDLKLVRNRNSLYEIAEVSPKGHYKRFHEKLGSGSYKTVYRAIDNDTGREVAWNILSTHGLHKKQKQQIRQEIELMKKLNHASILKLISAWHVREREEVVLITEIMTGGSLKSHLQKMRHPRLKLIKQWCRDILLALSYLHSWKPNPIIHRDIKCDNIFISSHSGQIKIGDFGLSTIMNSSCNKTAVGTPHYMAPEIFEERYGPGIDIYAFGMCLLEICTLSTPYKECDNPGNIYKKVSSGIRPLNFYMIKDDEVRNFIELCISKEELRPTAEQLLEHSFLKINENDEKIHKPVTLATDEPETPITDSSIPSNKSMEFSMIVNSNIPQKVTFNYNPEEDNPQQVAEEIANLLELKPDQIQSIIQTIEQNIKNTSATSPVRNLKKMPDSPLPSDENVDIYKIKESGDNIVDAKYPLIEIKDSIFTIQDEISQRDIIEISLCLSYTVDNHLMNENITFLFNITEDNPELVAEELVASIGIDSSYTLKISDLIEKKVLYHTQCLENPFFIEPVKRISCNYSSSDDLINLEEEPVTTPTYISIQNIKQTNFTPSSYSQETPKPANELDAEFSRDVEEIESLQTIIKLLGDRGYFPSNMPGAQQMMILQKAIQTLNSNKSEGTHILDDLQYIRQSCRSRTSISHNTEPPESIPLKYYEEGMNSKPFSSTFGNINKIL